MKRIILHHVEELIKKYDKRGLKVIIRNHNICVKKEVLGLQLTKVMCLMNLEIQVAISFKKRRSENIWVVDYICDGGKSIQQMNLLVWLRTKFNGYRVIFKPIRIYSADCCMPNERINFGMYISEKLLVSGRVHTILQRGKRMSRNQWVTKLPGRNWGSSCPKIVCRLKIKETLKKPFSITLFWLRNFIQAWLFNTSIQYVQLCGLLNKR